MQRRRYLSNPPLPSSCWFLLEEVIVASIILSHLAFLLVLLLEEVTRGSHNSQIDFLVVLCTINLVDLSLSRVWLRYQSTFNRTHSLAGDLLRLKVWYSNHDPFKMFTIIYKTFRGRKNPPHSQKASQILLASVHRFTTKKGVAENIMADTFPL